MTLSRISAVALATFLCAGLAQAEEATQAEEEGKRCISIHRISSTDIVDNQHIRFKMTGGPDYMNELPRKCIGLGKHDAFMYKTSLSQLCDLDIITVLDSVGGGYMRGASCGLGKFVPIEEEAEAEKQVETNEE